MWKIIIFICSHTLLCSCAPLKIRCQGGIRIKNKSLISYLFDTWTKFYIVLEKTEIFVFSSRFSKHPLRKFHLNDIADVKTEKGWSTSSKVLHQQASQWWDSGADDKSNNPKVNNDMKLFGEDNVNVLLIQHNGDKILLRFKDASTRSSFLLTLRLAKAAMDNPNYSTFEELTAKRQDESSSASPKKSRSFSSVITGRHEEEAGVGLFGSSIWREITEALDDAYENVISSDIAYAISDFASGTRNFFSTNNDAMDPRPALNDSIHDSSMSDADHDTVSSLPVAKSSVRYTRSSGAIVPLSPCAE